ncbi:hypothetical protein V2J09_000072 [Rumex salicifolius]
MASCASTSALRRPTAGKLPGRISTLKDLDLEFQLQMKKAIANTATFSAASTSTGIGGHVEGFNDSFRVYTKGMIVEDRNGVKLGALGVAIFNSSNDVVLEASEPLGLREGEIMTDQVAELEAFVRGLEFARRLELRNLLYTSLQFNLNANEEPKEAKVAELVHDALLLKKRFQQCDSSPAMNKNAQLVLELARSSIEKQGGKPLKDMVPTRNNCLICLEDVNEKEMLEFHSCRHRFCSSCITTHIQLKVRGGELPKCPQPDCRLALSIDICKMLLDPKMWTMMDQLVKESSIPGTEKVYCPSPKCSNLMSKAEALATQWGHAFTSRLQESACRCVKCYSLFCISCRVLWHSNMSCESYKIGESFWNSRSVDEKLRQLAGNNKWRKCPRCSHMVELASGCNHISCRCGHQFCYVCGLEWRKKRATCSCPLWDEANIIHRGGANGQ